MPYMNDTDFGDFEESQRLNGAVMKTNDAAAAAPAGVFGALARGYNNKMQSLYNAESGEATVQQTVDPTVAAQVEQMFYSQYDGSTKGDAFVEQSLMQSAMKNQSPASAKSLSSTRAALQKPDACGMSVEAWENLASCTMESKACMPGILRHDAAAAAVAPVAVPDAARILGSLSALPNTLAAYAAETKTAFGAVSATAQALKGAASKAYLETAAAGADVPAPPGPAASAFKMQAI
eukprot:Rhum_TRINITY_DN15408_c5_g1::Rhum_TRINITY_DN15408_c5_g1_i1::g.155464::m.155464